MLENEMIEPTITCPSCSTQLKLTESLAAPLIRATREEYDAKIAEKDADIYKDWERGSGAGDVNDW